MLMTILVAIVGVVGGTSLEVQGTDARSITSVAPTHGHRLLHEIDSLRAPLERFVAESGVDGHEASNAVSPATGGSRVRLADDSVLVDAPDVAKEAPPAAVPIQNVPMPMSSETKRAIWIAAGCVGIVGLGAAVTAALIYGFSHFRFGY